MLGSGGRGTAVAHRVAALSDRVAAGSFYVGGVGNGRGSDKRVLPNARRTNTWYMRRRRMPGRERDVIYCLEGTLIAHIMECAHPGICSSSINVHAVS